MAHDILVVGDRDGLGEKFAEYVSTKSGWTSAFVSWGRLSANVANDAQFLLVFGNSSLSEHVDRLQNFLREHSLQTVYVVSDFAAHFSDDGVREHEERLREVIRASGARIVIFRPSFIVSKSEPSVSPWLHRLWFLRFLFPQNWTSAFIEDEELFDAVLKASKRKPNDRERVLTLLGRNQSWRDVFQEYGKPAAFQQPLAWTTWIVSWLGLGFLAAMLFRLAAYWQPSLRRFQFGTLEPTTRLELLQLANPYNFQHIQIAGYNNGVVHFGWRFPGKTIVLTRQAGKQAVLNGNLIKADAGVTLNQAVQTAKTGGKEFFVLPNYSYVSIGTAFFVPIHGSGSEVSTLGESIEKVTFYDPALDCIRSLKRSDPEFAETIYNREKPLLLLRLYVRVRDKTPYYSHKSTHESLAGESIWDAFADADACNIEIRKAGSKAESIDVYKYYHQSPSGNGEVLEVPRDSLGRLWDRLEDNPISSWLFHFLTRKLGYHVELFLNRQEFLAFWKVHERIPLAKMQLRFMHRDGFSHSPCEDEDRVSIDIFMSRKRRDEFLGFMQHHFPAARFNPGKHSM